MTFQVKQLSIKTLTALEGPAVAQVKVTLPMNSIMFIKEGFDFRRGKQHSAIQSNKFNVAHCDVGLCMKIADDTSNTKLENFPYHSLIGSMPVMLLETTGDIHTLL